ncbi:MAG TPA: hypothetical protein VGL94_06090 [Ktedonobacteraceae bacterium]
MSALCIQAAIEQAGQYYLMPLSQVGDMAKQLAVWVKEGLAKQEMLHTVVICDEEGTHQIARGYEVERTCTDGKQSWQERVLVVQSFAFANKQCKSLDERHETSRTALTPPIGRGKRQITQQTDLVSRAEAILKKYSVKGLLCYTYERECEQEEKLVGRGRNGPNREREVRERVRYQITGVVRVRQTITEQKAMAGWRAYATNAPRKRLSLEQGVLQLSQRVPGRTGFWTLQS